MGYVHIFAGDFQITTCRCTAADTPTQEMCQQFSLLALWFTFLPMGLYVCMHVYMHAFLLGGS